MKRIARRDVLLFFASVCLIVLLAEAGLRFLSQPSEYSSGRFLGHELPPYKLLLDEPLRMRRNHSEWVDGLIVDGKKITVGDLWGIYREDALLGYVPQENTVSANGWWESNNIGARAREATSPVKPPGLTRLLVFGESLAQGSRVRQEESWPYVLGADHRGLEVVNLAVDGYGMAQAYLRYRGLRRQIEHDLVLLMFAPNSDLWRDVNIRRDVGGEWWGSYLSMPRYTLDDGQLNLVRPFPQADFYAREMLTPEFAAELKSHLRAYDRFYRDRVYETLPLVGKSMIYRLLLLSWHNHDKKQFRNSLWNTQSEAQRVLRLLFARMKKEVERDGKQFLLVTLPTYQELKQLANDPSVRERHQKLADSISSAGVDCLNLLEDLRHIPLAELDIAFDSSHYGPKANRRIAGLIRQHLSQKGVLTTAQEADIE